MFLTEAALKPTVRLYRLSIFLLVLLLWSGVVLGQVRQATGPLTQTDEPAPSAEPSSGTPPTGSPESIASDPATTVSQQNVLTPEVWLITYGPGEVYWQRFGHNGVWIRDAGLGLDHVFNFGFFDFAQENFFLRFLLGRMLYFSAAQPAQQEFSQYINDNRSIRAQKLSLTPQQALRLTEFLVEQVQPRNRDYLYDYYLDNCSTRVRDALNYALGGSLREQFLPEPAHQTWRDHTRRLTQADIWLYLGLELVLGMPIDQPVSRWDEFFIPSQLAAAVMDSDLVTQSGRKPLVNEDVMLFESSVASPPSRPEVRWHYYLLISLTALALALGLSKWLKSTALARVWLLISAATGSAMIFFWFGTDHAAAANNLNLLLFNPLWFLCLLSRRHWRPVAIAIAGVSCLALPAQWIPPGQYSADVLAAFLPLNLAAAWVLFSQPAANSSRV